MKRIFAVALVTLLAACDDPTGASADSWSFRSGTDAISGRPWASATTSSTFHSVDLVVRCREGSIDVQIRTYGILESTNLRYRVGEGPTHTERWNPSTDFESLFYPGDARQLAASIAAASEFRAEIRRIGRPAANVTLRTSGLDRHLPAIEAACA